MIHKYLVFTQIILLKKVTQLQQNKISKASTLFITKYSYILCTISHSQCILQGSIETPSKTEKNIKINGLLKSRKI